MTGAPPFTREQEARIAEIVTAIVLAVHDSEAHERRELLESALAWAAHRYGGENV